MVTNAEIAARAQGRTMLDYLRETQREWADRPMVRFKTADGSWAEWTYAQTRDKAARIATGLRTLGLQRGERVAIMMRNRPDFYPVDTGALLAGGTPFSIYNSSAPEQIAYIVHHSEAAIAVVEDIAFLERFLKVREELPLLRHIVVVEDPDGLRPDGVLTLDELLAHEPIDVDAASDEVKPEDLLTLVYTSGTTGPPKAAMITHANMTWTVESALALVGDDWKGVTYVSYLPIAHILERYVGYYIGMAQGGTVVTCPDVTQIAEYLREARPTVFAGVPRVYEKIRGGLMAVLGAQPPEQREPVERALEIGTKVAELRFAGEAIPADLQAAHDEAEASILSLVRSLVGLDQVRFCSTGAAPITPELLMFFRGLGIPLVDGYGMTESSCLICYDPYTFKPGTVGKAIPGVELRIAEDGEVLFRGGNVFAGYLKDPERTAEMVDDDGWLHTGDVGVIDDDGYLRIVDRKKELIITAGGKNISPANIEAALRAMPLIGQAAAIGDDRKFVSALVVLDPEVAPGWAAAQGITGTLEELAAHPEVIAEIEREVAEANQRFSQVEQVKRFTVLGEEWLPDSEILTPTMKLKRRGVSARYAAEIEAMYS